MPRDRTFYQAVEEVRRVRANELQAARSEKREAPKFNEIMRAALNNLDISETDRASLLHELAPYFGKHGGDTKPRKPRAKMSKEERKQRRLAKKFGFTPTRLTHELLMDCDNVARQAHLDTCPID